MNSKSCPTNGVQAVKGGDCAKKEPAAERYWTTTFLFVAFAFLSLVLGIGIYGVLSFLVSEPLDLVLEADATSPDLNSRSFALAADRGWVTGTRNERTSRTKALLLRKCLQGVGASGSKVTLRPTSVADAAAQALSRLEPSFILRCGPLGTMTYSED